MRYQKSNQRRAVILMVVLSLLTLFALVGVTFVLYADAEATAARVAREAQTVQVANVGAQEALAFFLGQLIYDVPDSATGVTSGLRGHSLARTMYGFNYVFPPPLNTPALNVVPFNGIGRLHFATASGVSYPFNPANPLLTPLRNVANTYAALPGHPIDDYVLVNYTWFSSDGFVRDPERYGVRTLAQVTANTQTNPYVGVNVPYTYPDLNNFFLAAMRADGTVLTPSYHRPWLFQVATVNVGGVPTPYFYAFNDMSNPNWTNPQGKYLTLRPRPAEHPLFPPPGDATGDVKNLPWAPGGNDSIWIDLGAPVMTAPDGTLYKMMFAPLILDLDDRINLNTAGNILAYNAINSALPSLPHASNQGWGSWEVNLARVLYGNVAVGAATQGSPVVTVTSPLTYFSVGDYVTVYSGPNTAPTAVQSTTISLITPPTMTLSVPWAGATGPVTLIDQEWTRLFTGKTQLSGQIVPGKYVANGPNLYTPTTNGATIPLAPSAISLANTLQHPYSQSDFNGLNETTFAAQPVTSSSRPLLPGFVANASTSDPAPNPFNSRFPLFTQGFINGGTENVNHPLLYNVFQNPLLNAAIPSRSFRASDMEALLRPNATINGIVGADSSSVLSDLTRLCPANFPSQATLASLPANLKSIAMRYANLVTTQSWDIGSPGVTPYWMNPYFSAYINPSLTTATPVPAYYMYAPSGAAVPFPTQAGNVPPPSTITNVPGTNPITSEFGPDWRSLSANSYEYVGPTFSTTFNPTVPAYNPYGTLPPGYVSPGARIRLNRPLPPYPHMGALLTPPYNLVPPQPYGVAYNLTQGNPVYNQYLAAQNARQALANDIYRRLVAIVGVAPFSNPANPAVLNATGGETAQQYQGDLAILATRRWLAQLAVNIVDYIDEDDIMTPLNFYTVAEGLNVAALGYVQGGDDPGTNAQNPITGLNATGGNPAYWVFGTEMPKVVLNEVLAEAKQLDTTKAASTDSNGNVTERVKVWVELYNTMPSLYPALSGVNSQPQDAYRVPLYMTNPSSKGYSPYRISICQWTQDQGAAPLIANTKATGTASPLPDVSSNVLGKAYITGPFPQSTTDQDFAGVIPLSQMLQTNPPSPAQNQLSFPQPPGSLGAININAGVDPGQYFLVGPTSDTTNYPNDPFVYDPNNLPTGTNGGKSLPLNIPVLQTPNMVYTPTWQANPTNPDERTTGLTVMLRRLANPYLPPQFNPALPNYNPYVTVDYIPSVPLMPAANSPNGIYSFGKRQPYAGLLLENGPPTYNPQTNNGKTTYTPSVNFSPNSPVFYQNSTATTQPPPPANAFNIQNGVSNTFGQINYPLPQSGHYDWLVHLDRAPISPMELLHVSAWPPYKLTQRFMLGADNTATQLGTLLSATYNWQFMYPNPLATSVNTVSMFAHYAPWLDLPPGGNATLPSVSCPWWFDDGTSGVTTALQSHRLYRLFEFLECGDRAFGVNGLGRIPGKVNINTIWDADTLQALIDANQSMGINPSLPNAPLNVTTDPVSQIFANMMNSRSAGYYNSGAYNVGQKYYTYASGPFINNPVPIGPVNMGTFNMAVGTDDRPFMPLSTGLYAPGSAPAANPTPGQGPQFPNGFSVGTDTILRTNNPPATTNVATYPPNASATGTPLPALNQWLLFQNYWDTAGVGTGLTTSLVHPYLQSQVLTKLYNNITTRSNVFAVFLTVGFFQVINPATSPPQLGPEIGRSEGKQVRHRMFAIVDRTNLSTFFTFSNTPVTGPSPATNPPNLTGAQTIFLPPAPAVTGGVNALGQTYLSVANPIIGAPGIIVQGTQLVVDAGNINEETITVTAVTPPVGAAPATITANFTLPHGAGGLPYTIIQRGNPGPWLLTPYDPRIDPFVVPYFSIID